MRSSCDIVIIGAGAAGLSAMSDLVHEGRDVMCLEATSRLGGRIFTIHDPLAALPIELGAEFVHGRPPEIGEWIRGAHLPLCEHTIGALHIRDGHVQRQAEAGSIANRILESLAKHHTTRDESFEEYLRRSKHSAETKAWARVHIEGFNAARSELISVASLIRDSNASEKIEGDRIFRLPGGYDSLIAAIVQSIPDHSARVHLNCIVERIRWRRGVVEVQFRSSLDQQHFSIHCQKAIITVSLGVLQACARGAAAIEFEPFPNTIMKAAAALRFGRVYRVTFRFTEAFWEDRDVFKRSGFWISGERRFGTWWTSHPIMSTMLTGWLAGREAEEFQFEHPHQIEAEALAALGRILNRRIPKPEAFHFHNWQTDPFFRGAYSYVPVNAPRARGILSTPVEDTLFFAGEAAERYGHSGTVHGAIASGKRAARLVCGK